MNPLRPRSRPRLAASGALAAALWAVWCHPAASAAQAAVAPPPPPAADPAAQAADARLKAVASRLNSAKALRFVATVQESGDAKAAYIVSGLLEAPNRIAVSVSGAPADAPAPLLATIHCDGRRYTAIDPRGARYVTEAAPSSGYEPDSPSANFFLRDILSGGGAAALDAAEAISPAGFVRAPRDAPETLRRTVVTSTRSVTVGGAPCTDIAQAITNSRGTSVYHTVVSDGTDRLVRLQVTRQTPSGPRVLQTITFEKLDALPAGLAPARFAAAAPAAYAAYQAPASPGMPAPAFTAQSAAGAPVSLADYRGKVVVIDFWATWCPPCMATLPSTDKLAAEYQPKGVAFLPICTWDTKANFQRWAASHADWSMPWLLDPAAMDTAGSIAARAYAVSGIPTQYVIDKSGVIVYRGFADSDAGEKPLVAAIDKALADAAAASATSPPAPAGKA